MGARGPLLPLIGLCCAGLCLAAPVQAQVRFGVSGELNRTSFGGVPPDEAAFESALGTGFAGIVEVRVHRDVVLSFQPGWIQKGAKVVFNKDEEPDSVETFVIEQTWMTMPVYFRIDSDGRGFYAGGGLSLDFLLESEVENRGATVDNRDAFDDIDLVYQFTAGYLGDRGGYSWFLEARYLQGMTSISDSDALGGTDAGDFKSTGLRFVGGLLF